MNNALLRKTTVWHQAAVHGKRRICRKKTELPSNAEAVVSDLPWRRIARLVAAMTVIDLGIAVVLWTGAIISRASSTDGVFATYFILTFLLNILASALVLRKGKNL